MQPRSREGAEQDAENESILLSLRVLLRVSAFPRLRGCISFEPHSLPIQRSARHAELFDDTQ